MSIILTYRSVIGLLKDSFSGARNVIVSNMLLILITFVVCVGMKLFVDFILGYLAITTDNEKNSGCVEKGEYGLVIIVNSDYKMEKGKVLSQVCHGMSKVMTYLFRNNELRKEWKRNGEAKIVLKGSSAQIEQIIKDTELKGIRHHAVYDAGRTQVPPGANTVVVLGPALRDQLTPISGHLKLY
ncbi:peptidyl-tRNA hydrolase [Ordospora colligata]|uniref:peptidyl-tRNA hydrolase n=1 Tax=Ordospora colligata OC4 TaxID=1354746 RepID=A0A0B2UKY4_9MICR|nr:peptidyl-tRNA hydrolase [Ordospora colligata OC4]KHN69919.1 peptidyl-tRNA hydrolase [Ordospora colligata OC4]TBU16089.1 peptidyl-tRNA hydrolase [Ordospora colligata]TBU16302.1 peptidyl-tRNA hydrolase [Ordospora colligata]TBU19006.1 peptidyl-tRNA hydrolase [Ordospora colligata]